MLKHSPALLRSGGLLTFCFGWFCFATVGQFGDSGLVGLFLPECSAADKAEPFCPVAGDRAITDRLKTVRQKYQLPAIAGAIITSKGLVVVGVVGVRKRGTDVAATLTDEWPPSAQVGHA